MDPKKALAESEKITDEAWKEIYRAYENARMQLQNEIDALVARFGVDNQLSNEEVNQILHGKEYTKWRMSLREYLNQIRDVPEDSSLLLELNALSAKSRISLKEQLLADIDRAMTDIALEQCDITKKAISKVYETTYYRTAYDVQRGTGFAFNLAKLDHGAIEKVITYPWSTKVFSRAIWDNLDKMTATLKKTLAEGFAKGAGVQRMAKVLNDEFKSGRYAAERVIRTESKHFHMQSQLDSFRELGYEEYIFHMNGTCSRTRKGVKICDCETAVKGSPYRIEDAEPGINLPPIHPNCKCYITAKRKINMFEKREGITPLHENVKFQQWKNTYVK